MANFNGYLFATYDKSQGKVIKAFPNKYIQLDSWTSTPNQREELKAYRDDNTRNLHRVTASGKKSVFSFKTIKDLHLDEKTEIQKFFTSVESNKDQRKVTLQFWNDETNSYQVGDFYRPNMQFPIHKITENDIVYQELQFDFVEY